ncbi:MAG TPA: hypothetical protein VKK61_00335 [Tepidisphaeraceae bacterium]|nr:hypothetical protein [Tepidisphaeraceae bacterium]
MAALNIFQRLTRQWDRIHPYNAAQAMQLVGSADHEKLATTWKATLADVGLTAGENNPILRSDSLQNLMSAELNYPFDEGSPFRPFVIDDSQSHFIGVVYHHWIADSFSIRMLLREWFLRIYDLSFDKRLRFRVKNPGYWKLFGPAESSWNLGGAILDLSRWSARFRRARRIDPNGFREFRTHFTLHHAPRGLINSISVSARRRGFTVNDVFLAAMAQACDAIVPAKRTPRRPDLALGTIVDLRSRAKQPLHDAFGFYLGFTSVFCRPDELSDWDRLLEKIHHQNVMQKNSAAAEASMVRMSAGLIAGMMFDKPRLMEFYRKRLALAGGISNVNLNHDWPAKYFPSPLLDYVRISPCGPMMPVVFTPTTLGDQLNIGLTCRESVVDLKNASALAAIFLDRLRKFAVS